MMVILSVSGCGKVGTGESLSAAQLLEETLGGGGHIGQTAVTGQLLTGPIGLKLEAHVFDQVVCTNIRHFED